MIKSKIEIKKLCNDELDFALTVSHIGDVSSM